MLPSDPCVHRYTSAARLLPPLGPLHFLHSSLSLVRPLSSAFQCFTIIWRSHFFSIQERLSFKLLEEYSLLRFLSSSAFEFQGKEKKRTFLEVFCYIKAACQQQQQRCGSDVISTFSQQRSATHPKDNRWLLADFISSQRQEPEGKTNKSVQSLFALRNVTPTEHKQICSIKYLHQYA